ncbi:hypothetical protein SSX86_025622 [Deinandra increscens subsp. villosa]|uniref:Uncharacterized protein n=1 Tax=Deinandra increscens subsp. villosa TaxID=3103831 RepID=A0AAP0CD03_9ASTR
MDHRRCFSSSLPLSLLLGFYGGKKSVRSTEEGGSHNPKSSDMALISSGYEICCYCDLQVRFGETLRRLNVSINDKKLVFDMAMLKEKIRSLFGFDSDVEFTMTYVDEDDDVVTLADDDDLHDVVRQSLNPLRVTVSLLNNSNFNVSSGNSPQNQVDSENLKSVPEPLLEALAKLPLDLASKASSSAPVFAELVEKLKDAYSNKILPSMASETRHPANGGPPNAKSGSSTVVNPEVGGSDSKKNEKQVQKVTPISGKDKNTSDGDEKKNGSSFEKKDAIKSGSLSEPLKHNLLPSSYAEKLNQRVQQPQKNQMGAQFAHVASDINKNTHDSRRSSFWAQGLLNATNQCPFSGMPLTSDADSQGRHLRSDYNSYWNRYGPDDNGMGNIFHRGVRCDGCGAHPIIGPRFKSRVKDNYDLCRLCFFAGMGKATDYIRIDHPINGFGHHLTPYNKGFYDPSLRNPSSTLPPPPPLPPMLHPPMWAPELKLSQSKLDSQFILDVNVLDGTIMAPLTTFTKIWRMRNNGSIIWPYGSVLQWIGGDRLGSSDCVHVEIPVDGLPVDKELDIEVDFTAPELPGRYVSYWTMVSPSGQKFGQRVWVLIQVDASMKNLGETPINLNLPPVTSDVEAVKQDRLVDSDFLGNDIVTNSESSSTDLPPKDHEMNFPTNDSLIIDNGGPSSTIDTLSGPSVTASGPLSSLPPEPKFIYPPVGLDVEPVSIPTVDFSAVPPIMSSGSAASPTGVLQPSGSSGPSVTDDQEQALVKELEEMGFKEVELNKLVLRMTNYDLEKSVDSLCGVLDWDPMLDELQEMGFADDEANRRLLIKNNGSIKRVVMDLISEEKA